jgi:peptidoglycan/LPS O-acetylase OafA/YrhL
MTQTIKILALAVVLIFSLLLAVITGDYAPWYFAWLVGTTMIVLIAVAGAVLFQTQDAARAQRGDLQS